MKQLYVKHLMSAEVVTLDEDEDLGLADAIMALARIRHLPVVDKQCRLIGLITHRDLLRAQGSIFATGRADNSELTTFRASEVMIHDVKTTTPETPALNAAKEMYSQKLGCMPVVTEDRLVGIITEADFLKLAIEGLEISQGAAQ